MPEKARKTGGGNYFQSAPHKKAKSVKNDPEPEKEIANGSDGDSAEDISPAAAMDDSGVFDIAAAEAALNNISSASNTSTDIDVSTDVEISEDSKEDTAGGVISITIPPELLGEIPEGSDISGSDGTMTDLPSEDNSVVSSEVPAEDIREEEEDVTAEADDSALDGVLDEDTAAEAAAGPVADDFERLSDGADDAETAAVTAASDEQSVSSAEDDRSFEIEEASEPADESSAADTPAMISPFLLAQTEKAAADKAEADKAETGAAEEKPEVDGKKEPPKKIKENKPTYKKGIVVGITAAALVFGAFAFANTNYVYRHMPLGLNTHIRSSENVFNASAKNDAVNGLNGDITFSYSVEGAALKSHTSGKITVGEFIRSIGDELKHETAAGEKWEYASNYPNSTVLEDGMEVKIDLVSQRTVTSTDVLKYSTEVIGTDDLPKGERIVLRSGIDGLVRRVYSQKFVNGEMISNDIAEQEILSEPQSEVVYEGVGGVFVSPTTGKSYEYLYYIDCEATAYGVDTGFGGDSPWAYSGKLIEIGDIAVDPEVIPLKTKCYVYCDEYDIGYVSAEDIGGAIKGNKIDIYMGKDYEAQKQFGRRQVRVYILELPEEEN